jgi:glyoxylase-like metal-dependent hydrolase (beta-lactamase superfamily II)
MARIRAAPILSGLALSTIAFRAQTPAPQAAYRFQQIVPGVYSAIGTGTVDVGSNSAVIIDRDEVMIVDSHISPESRRLMLQELKAITDKPVRFLMNTHFHYDHTNGNQAFWPGVDVIGHQFIQPNLTGDILEKTMFADLLKGIPKQLDDLKARAAGEADAAALPDDQRSRRQCAGRRPDV